MGGGVRHWLSSVRRALSLSSCKSMAVVEHTFSFHEKHEHITTDDTAEKEDEEKEEREDGEKEELFPVEKHPPGQLPVEELAAIKLQACFRGHLARRAFLALRSLVKLQAMVRGAYVRRQTRLAAHCMDTLARLHLRVRSRNMLAGTVHAEPIEID